MLEVCRKTLWEEKEEQLLLRELLRSLPLSLPLPSPKAMRRARDLKELMLEVWLYVGGVFASLMVVLDRFSPGPLYLWGLLYLASREMFQNVSRDLLIQLKWIGCWSGGGRYTLHSFGGPGMSIYDMPDRLAIPSEQIGSGKVLGGMKQQGILEFFGDTDKRCQSDTRQNYASSSYLLSIRGLASPLTNDRR